MILKLVKRGRLNIRLGNNSPTCGPNSVTATEEINVIPSTTVDDSTKHYLQELEKGNWTLDLTLTVSRDFNKKMMIGLEGSVLNQLLLMFPNKSVKIRIKVNVQKERSPSAAQLLFYEPEYLKLVTSEMPLMSSNGSVSCFDSNVSISFKTWTTLRQNQIIGNVTISAIIDNTFGEGEDDRMSINRKILEEKIASDVSILSANGQIKCHQNFLLAHSALFEADFKPMEEPGQFQLNMEDLSENGVKALLAYLYWWDITDAKKESGCGIALELLKVSCKYELGSLRQAATQVLLDKNLDGFDVNGGLELFLCARDKGDKGLKRKSVQALKLKSSELEACPRYKQLFTENPVAAMELCKFSFSSSDE